MEQIAQQLSTIASSKGLTNYSIDLKGKLTPEEAKKLEVKYSGKTFGVMTEEERWFAAQTLLLKISAITGWTIPVSEMMDILIDQFQKKLQEGYRNLTIAEVEYAFRNRGLDVRDWGKAMNLGLMDEIMLPYLEERVELSKLEESLKKPKQIERSKELTDEEWEEWITDIKNYPLELIPVPCYDYLLRIGKINPTVQEKKDYMDKAIPFYAISIQENLREWNDFIKQKQDNKITGKHFDGLVIFSKRLIVSDYLKNNP